MDIDKDGYLVAIDSFAPALGQVDVYKYRRTGIIYQYSFNNGLSSSSDVEGAAYAPASKE